MAARRIRWAGLDCMLFTWDSIIPLEAFPWFFKPSRRRNFAPISQPYVRFVKSVADLHKRKPPPLAGRFEKALPLRRAFLLAKAPMGLRRKAQG